MKTLSGATRRDEMWSRGWWNFSTEIFLDSLCTLHLFESVTNNDEVCWCCYHPLVDTLKFAMSIYGLEECVCLCCVAALIQTVSNFIFFSFENCYHGAWFIWFLGKLNAHLIRQEDIRMIKKQRPSNHPSVQWMNLSRLLSVARACESNKSGRHWLRFFIFVVCPPWNSLTQHAYLLIVQTSRS